ncbi:carbohydrate sulfotransferase 3-like [Limulus polyphemus]|uniref:Carbohydrate sulfotransferase 3-like n=1 Tax=Limulus polyphemus TaxID=6850 RepID=A0ABM1BWI1_LIMPO|nr:carbohydrate sulfotransferase 3-like [Limulus polyphemus]
MAITKILLVTLLGGVACLVFLQFYLDGWIGFRNSAIYIKHDQTSVIENESDVKTTLPENITSATVVAKTDEHLQSLDSFRTHDLQDHGLNTLSLKSDIKVTAQNSLPKKQSDVKKFNTDISSSKINRNSDELKSQLGIKVSSNKQLLDRLTNNSIQLSKVNDNKTGQISNQKPLSTTDLLTLHSDTTEERKSQSFNKHFHLSNLHQTEVGYSSIRPSSDEPSRKYINETHSSDLRIKDTNQQSNVKSTRTGKIFEAKQFKKTSQQLGTQSSDSSQNERLKKTSKSEVSLRSNKPSSTEVLKKLEQIVRQTGSVLSKGASLANQSNLFLSNLPEISPTNVTFILIVTYFRSGSTFLGELLQQNRMTFYHFEPLHFMSDGTRIVHYQLPEALNHLRNLLRCDFQKEDEYFRWIKQPRNQFLFQRNQFLWQLCHLQPWICFTPYFVRSVCKRARTHVMKLTRLQMSQVEMFLKQNLDLNIHVLYLVRDPRGTLSSRQVLDWCMNSNCSNYRVLCTETEKDLDVFYRLQADNPTKFTLIRYEDLAVHPQEQSMMLFERLQLHYSSAVPKFIASHTRRSEADPYSTHRNSSAVAFEWRHRLSFPQIENIQKYCSGVLRTLGYDILNSTSDIGGLPPILEHNHKKT